MARELRARVRRPGLPPKAAVDDINAPASGADGYGVMPENSLTGGQSVFVPTDSIRNNSSLVIVTCAIVNTHGLT